MDTKLTGELIEIAKSMGELLARNGIMRQEWNLYIAAAERTLANAPAALQLADDLTGKLLCACGEFSRASITRAMIEDARAYRKARNLE